MTDLVGSTPLARALGDDWPTVLAAHDRLVRAACETHGGVCTAAQGDGAVFVFERGADALAAAWEMARTVESTAWPGAAHLRVRSGLHKGPYYATSGIFSGVTIHEAARVAALAGSGRIVLTEVVREEVHTVPAGSRLTDLGLHAVRDFPAPVRLFCLEPEHAAGMRPDMQLPSAFTTPFFGRSTDLEGIAGALLPNRLVTIVGPGGIGKTRLAAELVDRHPGDALLLELAEVPPDGKVEALLLDRLGRGQSSGRDLVELVGSRALLIVLDNCEHVADQVRALCERMLRRCPRVMLVATSRETLRLPAEQPWFLTSLDPGAAAELFVAAAARSVGATRAALLERREVSAICDRVDAVPLAIELAAGRLRSLGLADLAARMDEQMDLLVDRRRPGAGRQQTMRATIDWSHRALDESGRELLGALSVPPGGATIECLAALLPGPEEFALLDTVEDLIVRSLVNVEEGPDGRTRYRSMEPIRQFASSALAEPDKVTLADRHAEWICRRVPLVTRELLRRVDARRELHAEAANIGAAIRHLLDRGDVEAALRLVGMLGYFWFSERPSEGWTWTRLTLDACTGQEAPRRRAGALVTAGQLLERQLRLEESKAALLEAVALSEGVGGSSKGWGLFWLGRNAAIAEHAPEARAAFAGAASEFETAADPLGSAWARLWLADLTEDGSEARALADRLVLQCRADGLQHVLAPALLNLSAKFAFQDGDPDFALDLIDEAIAIQEGLGDAWQIVDSVIGGASLATSFDRPEAWALLELATDLIVDHADEAHRRHYVGLAAEAFRRRGQLDLAATLAWGLDDRWNPPYDDFGRWVQQCRSGLPRPPAPGTPDEAVERAVAEVRAAGR